MPDPDSDPIVLGWRVTNGLDPCFWLGPKPIAGSHSLDDVVTAEPASIAHHTVLVAQSGSGKSYFLGRILEEICLKTKSRLVIFDPNADFRRIDHIIDKDPWEKTAGYNLSKRQGFLPDDKTKDNFERQWRAISKTIQTMGRTSGPHHEQLQIAWPAIRTDFLMEELAPSLKNELAHCHEVVRTLGELVVLTKDEKWKAENDLLDFSRRFFELTRRRSEREILLELKEEFREKVPASSISASDIAFTVLDILKRFTKSDSHIKMAQLREKAAVSRGFVSEDAERIYFSSAFAVKGSGILISGEKKDSADGSHPRIQVVDLPSISDPQYRLLAVSTTLETIWARSRDRWEAALEKPSRADDRRPTFIVVDEAHNLIPVEPRNSAERRLREQFRTVAAEGRKFGLFLILVSQRPDKLDGLVVSECENRAVMRLGSRLVLDKTKEILGLGDLPNRTLEKCLEFEVGRALIIGPWVAEGHTFLYSGARRTQEGGRNLKEAFWASPDVAPVGRKEVNDPKEKGADRKKSEQRADDTGAAISGSPLKPSLMEGASKGRRRRSKGTTP
jgi:Helicase HerA, central domain